MAAVSGDQIWVAAGVYYPDESGGMTNNDRTATFTLIDGVELYGGFAGGETSLSQRNWDANVTVLSGDIDQNDTTDPNGVVTDAANITGNNAYHVVTGGGTDYGGFLASYQNIVSGSYASVSGGRDNTASGIYAAISGGNMNGASGGHASISGGKDNIAGGIYSSVSAGEDNTAGGSYASASGGLNNAASGIHSTVSGGANDSVSGGADWRAGDLFQEN